MKKIVLKAKYIKNINYLKELKLITNTDKSFVSDGNWALSTDIVDLEKTFTAIEKLKKGKGIREMLNRFDCATLKDLYRLNGKEGLLSNPAYLQSTSKHKVRYVCFTLCNGVNTYINADYYELFKVFELRGGTTNTSPIGAYINNKLCGIIMPVVPRHHIELEQVHS